MKKLLIAIFAVVMVLFCGQNVNAASEKVHVYVFQAGGCPYCEAEIEYLEGLDGYNKTFDIVTKELYVDHVDWAQGEDYELGVAVANAFNEAGFSDAAYNATPFVVISDLYAAAGYSTDLESYINTAVEEGDKDIVGCYANGTDTCTIRNYDGSGETTGSGEDVAADASNSQVSGYIILAILLVAAGLIVFASKKSKVQEEKN